MTDTELQERASQLIVFVEELIRGMLAMEHKHQAAIQSVHPTFQKSTRNLLHYLALRQVDVRQLQMSLSELGLSSLGRMEAYALSGLINVLRALHGLALNTTQTQTVETSRSEPVLSSITSDVMIDLAMGRSLLHQHTAMLMGEALGARTVRIMVTMPSEAATDINLIHRLLKAGMNMMRINCAHDGPEAWQAMIRNLRRAERELGRQCKVYADLAGPKLRTGILANGAQVCKVKPQRDIRGQVSLPATVCFTSVMGDTSQQVGDETIPTIPIAAEFITTARKGDVLRLRDARGKRRELVVMRKSAGRLFAESASTIYFETGLPMDLKRKHEIVAATEIGPLPRIDEPIRLWVGDTLYIVREAEPDAALKRPSTATSNNKQAHTISCTLPEVFDCAKTGERIFFDDGKIAGRIMRNTGRRLTVRITQAAPGGSRLASEKGINLPDTDLKVPALTKKDLADLKFIANKADIIGMSFVRETEDIQLLQQQLQALGARHVCTVLKIENRQAFENLPKLLLSGMTHPPLGVMVARGDLAVEVGFERLAEVQEEILWLCEAAHVPVIWATQVLETMAKSGLPSRAEVTDAVMSGRAECVMLNKGPYMVEVVTLLSDILERMSAHQSKKRSLLRSLSISRLD